MTVDELVRLGVEREDAGDLEGAERAYREADELCDAEGAMLLGTLLKRRGDLGAAAAAFGRAEDRGYPEAAASLGGLLWDNGDTKGAKAAFERSVAAGSANAVLNLGLLLAQEGVVEEALGYLRSAEERGFPEASWAIGKLLEAREDFAGAATAYRKGADGGIPPAAYGLGRVLFKLGDQDGAQRAFERARDLGFEGAAKVLEAFEETAKIVTVRERLEAMTATQMTETLEGEPAIPPLMVGEERLLLTVHRADGNRNDIHLMHRRPTDDQMMGTGEPINFVAVIRSTDEDPNDTSALSPWQRGPTERSVYIAIARAVVDAPPLPGTSVWFHQDLQWFADRIRADAGSTPSVTETVGSWVHIYVSACGEVLSTANACLEVANRAVGARGEIAKHQDDGLPGTPMAIRNFTRFAEEAEHQLVALHQTFEEKCCAARDTAAQLLASTSESHAEMLLAMTVPKETLDQVATAKGILGATYGPTPGAFLQGVDRANELMQHPPDEGNIYRPLGAAESDALTSPWSAETINAPGFGAAATNEELASATLVADEVRAVVIAGVCTLTQAWSRASAQLVETQQKLEAIRGFIAETSAQIEQLKSSRVLSKQPPREYMQQAAKTPTVDFRDPVVPKATGGWTVRNDIATSVSQSLREANDAVRDAAQRSFLSRWSLAGVAFRGIASVQTYVAQLDHVCGDLSGEIDRITSERLAETQRIRIELDSQVTEGYDRLIQAVATLPPAMQKWNSSAWAEWAPVHDHPEVLVGELRLRHGQVPDPVEGFASAIVTPVFVAIRDALRVSHRHQGRGAALALARSLLLRALASTPPDKLRLAVFDPTGLGQSVSSLLELGEYDRDLIGGKVWSSSEDLQRLLVEHTAHIELVIQRYLRAEYTTLDEFNVAAGEIAEPYRLLVIFDAPVGFDERSFAELRRIIENGPRCGVSTLLITDEDVQSPYGVSFDGLPQSLRTIRLHGPIGYGHGNKTFEFELTADSDAGAPEHVVRSIIHEVGKAAQDSTSTAVSFEKSFGLFSQAAVDGRKRGLPRLSESVEAANPDSWWKQTTVEGISAPIGQRGARDVATLTLDSSDHSGALLVGRQGSGKSTLLHAFIAGITTLYGPEELELHLIDFKEGVEFKVYAANSLPHARTVAIESDREFGVSVLQAIQAELAWRGSLLRGSESHSSLETLRRATGERLPRILLIFDEFQVLFARNDKLGAVAAEALETLIRQGRGFGIHVLLGSQSLAGLDALGSHVPQLLPVRILLPAAHDDVFKVLGEGNGEGMALTTAGEGILNMSGGAVEANERFRGAVIDEDARRARVSKMRAKADAAGFNRRPVVFEGNAPIPAEDTPPEQFVDEIRGADAKTLRLRFGVPMAIAGSVDINLRRESGANVLLVARDAPIDVGGLDAFSLPSAVTTNLIASAVARQASVEVVDFLPLDEGLDGVLAPFAEASAINLSRRRQVPDLLKRIGEDVKRRVDDDDTLSPATFLVVYGMHRARDFDQDSVDYDPDADLPELLGHILRDGPEVGVHTFIWFETLGAISRRLPSSAIREISWRLAGKMSADDSSSFIGVDGASSLREQQLIAANEDRGMIQRCTTIASPPAKWIREVLFRIDDRRS